MRSVNICTFLLVKQENFVPAVRLRDSICTFLLVKQVNLAPDCAIRSVNIFTFLLVKRVNLKQSNHLIAPCAAAAVRTMSERKRRIWNELLTARPAAAEH